MSPAAPEATNRASTTPRSDGVARLVGRGGEVATATGKTPRRSMQTRRRLPDDGATRQASLHGPPPDTGRWDAASRHGQQAQDLRFGWSGRRESNPHRELGNSAT